VLRRGRDTARLQGIGEGDRRVLHPRRRAAEAAVGVRDHPARAGDVEHRREVHVDADVAQVARRQPSLLPAVGAAAGAHLLGRGVRGAGEALDQAPLLVGHDQQRVAQVRRAGNVLQAPDQPPPGGPAGKVLGEEDDAGGVPLADHPLDRGGHRGAAEAEDDALPGELGSGEKAGGARPRRRTGTDRDPEGEGADREHGEARRRGPASGGQAPRTGRS
jgi:hypothetical protein